MIKIPIRHEDKNARAIDLVKAWARQTYQLLPQTIRLAGHDDDWYAYVLVTPQEKTQCLADWRGRWEYADSALSQNLMASLVNALS